MKKFYSKVLAVMMAVIIAFTQLPVNQVFAAEAVYEDNTGIQDTSEEKGTPSDADIESSSSENNIENTSEEEITEENTEEGSDEIPAEETLLNYIFVEKPYITTPDSQNIMAEIGTQNTVIEGAVLQYINYETGEEFTVSANKISGNTVLFSVNHADGEKAVYKLSGMTYIILGKEYSIDFASAGMDILYGINKEADVTPDDIIISPEESGEAGENIVYTDESGNVISNQNIGDVLQENESSVPEVSTFSLEESSNTLYSSNQNLIVVLDPGHDSTHAGANQNGYYEEELVLKIAQYCKEELEKYFGVTVYMTRTGSECPAGGSGVSGSDCLTYRTDFAAAKNADVFVSLHLNSSTSSSANGAGVYYPNSNYRPDLGQEGKELAQKIFDNLNALGLNSWAGGTLIHNSENNTTYPDGSLADYLAVIRECKKAGIPAVLIEHAFISNVSDTENFLSTDEKLKALGVADAEAIAEYYGLVKSDGYIYEGIDYSAVFDFDYYIGKYSDVANTYGSNVAAALRQFVVYGIAEGRQGNAEFNVITYKNRYADLRAAYGDDLKSYYLHYIKYGKAEGRSGAGSTSLTGYVTKYDGVDYSAVYDYNYYISKYSDVKNAYGNNDVAALRHFVLYGMAEGRQAKSDFDVMSYLYTYSDLRSKYGSDLKSYYLHYMNYGKSEGRKATGVTSMQNIAHVYDGVDYSSVYNFSYYVNKYSDVKNKYGLNDTAVLRHFVVYGIAEGRQGNSDFIVGYYRNNYADLRLAYGDNLSRYYTHYINYGKSEGRIANKLLYTSIMGNSGTTVSQLMAYYNVYATYPSFYANSDAPDLQTFCQMYIEEAKAEGVKAEVAFAQAMKETNFLKFTGDVSIEQYNFAGLGATGNGVKGNSFSSVREGIRAHIQHLKAYASTEELNNACVDPRFQYVTRGSAPYVEWLGIQENPYGVGWASAKNYGYELKTQINRLLSY